MTNTDTTLKERAVMVCPQCEGEGGYPDGLDEAACHTDCTRCGGNGWIVDLAALTKPAVPDVGEAEAFEAAAKIAISHSNYGHVEGNKRAFVIANDLEQRATAIRGADQ